MLICLGFIAAVKSLQVGRHAEFMICASVPGGQSTCVDDLIAEGWKCMRENKWTGGYVAL